VQIGPHGDLLGVQTQLRVVKHRGRSWETALDLVIGPEGPDDARELVQLALRLGCLRETAFGLLAGDRRVGRTAGHAAATLASDPALARTLEDAVRVAWHAQAGPQRVAGVS
jgi:hypothetical protein